MPPAGGPVRADALGTISKVVHERFVSEELGELLEELRPYEESLDFDSDEASLIRVARRDRDKEVNVPTELREAQIARRSRGVPGLGRGAGDQRLRALPAVPRAEHRAAARVRIVLRGRRALRRAARRLRAGDEDPAGARRLHPAPRGSRPPGRRAVGPGDRRLVPLRRLPGRTAAGDAARSCSSASGSARAAGASTRWRIRSPPRSGRRTSG